MAIIINKSPEDVSDSKKRSQAAEVIDMCGYHTQQSPGEAVEVDYISSHATSLTGFKEMKTYRVCSVSRATECDS